MNTAALASAEDIGSGNVSSRLKESIYRKVGFYPDKETQQTPKRETPKKMASDCIDHVSLDNIVKP